MIKKTHLAVGLALSLIFLPHVSHKLLFIPIVLFASLLPDIDSAYSSLGHIKVFRPLQWFVKHRGLIHSFTFCAIVSIALTLIWPGLGLPFFIGYFGHLLADSFTIEGVAPFWPLKREVRGKFRTGGAIEEGLFLGLVLLNVVLFASWFI